MAKERNDAEQTAPKKRQKNTKRGRVLGFILTGALTLLLVVLALLVFLHRDELRGENLRRTFGRSTEQVLESEAYTYETGTEALFATVGDGLAVASGSALQLLDDAGKTVFKQLVSYAAPAVFAGKDAALFCDIGSKNAVWANRLGESRAIVPSGNLLSADMNQAGSYLLVTEAAGYKALVSVYNAEGELQYEWWSGTGYVLRAVLSPDGRTLAVLCAENGGGRLHIFSLSSDKERAGVSFPGELPFDLRFMGSDTLCAVSQEGLRFLNTDGDDLGSHDFGGYYLTDYCLNSEHFAVVCVSAYRAGAGGMLMTVYRSGEVLGWVELDRDVLSLDARGRQVLVMTGNSLDLYGQSMGLQHSAEQLMTAKRALLRDRGDVLLLSAYAAERVKF